MKRMRWLSLMMAILFVFGASAQAGAQRPDPHSPSGEAPTATPGATPAPADTGCTLVEAYTADLYSAIDDSGAFAEFFYSDDEFGDITPAEAEEIIADGETMTATLDDLEVPAAYAGAHANILTWLQINIDMARFYGIDSSVVPDLTAYDEALNGIYQGEAAIAEACPEEIDAVGGYILLDPAGFEGELLPDDIPE